MKRVALHSLLLPSIGLSCLTALTALPLFSSMAVAQTASSADLLQNPQSGESASSDPFANNGSGQMGSMLDLIHRATLGSPISSEEFLRNQRESISTEAQEFRLQQLDRLQQAPPSDRPSPEAN